MTIDYKSIIEQAPRTLTDEELLKIGIDPDLLAQECNKPPKEFSREELEEMGIDPDLFVFASRPDFTDNAHALWKYITENTHYKTIWLIQKREIYDFMKNKGINCVLKNSMGATLLLEKAHYLICTVDFFSYNITQKKQGQIWINLWHGSGVKAHDFSERYKQTPHLKLVKKDSELTDLFLVQSLHDKFCLASILFCDTRKMIVTGQARLDSLLQVNGKINISYIFAGISNYKKLVLYTPTYKRTSYEKVSYYAKQNLFNLNFFESNKINLLLEKHSAAIVIKLHPNEEQNFKLEDIAFSKHCYLLKSTDLMQADLQMNDVLNAFDVMIADYSSIAYDFLRLDRPIIYNIADREEYSQKQGFVFHNIDYWMPGEKVFDFDGLLLAIEDALVNPNKYQKQRQEIIAHRYDYNDNNAAKRCLEAIENFKPIVDHSKNYYFLNYTLPLAKQYEEEIDSLREQLGLPPRNTPLPPPQSKMKSRFLHLTEVIAKKDPLIAQKILDTEHSPIYFLDKEVKHYLSKQNYSETDIAKWNLFESVCKQPEIPIVVPNPKLQVKALEYRNQNVHLITSGVNNAFFTKQQGTLPLQLEEIIAQGKPIVGYCGTIHKDIYFSLMQYACDACKDYNFVFIGEDKVKGKWSGLFGQFSNLFLLSEVDYADVPAVIKSFDIAIIPYFRSIKNRIPVKLFEYFACGKPVVTSDMPNCAVYVPVFASDSHGEFVRQLKKAMTVRGDPAFIAKTKEIAIQNDWADKAEQVVELINNLKE